jgi:hypothetical protein
LTGKSQKATKIEYVISPLCRPGKDFCRKKTTSSVVL